MSSIKKEFIQDVHYYLEDGRIVFTTVYHIQRGECCGAKCRHCPYKPRFTKGAKELESDVDRLKED